MPASAFSRGLSPVRVRNISGARKVGLNPAIYFVLTKADGSLVNAKLHPNDGAPNYDLKHDESDITFNSSTGHAHNGTDATKVSHLDLTNVGASDHHTKTVSADIDHTAISNRGTNSHTVLDSHLGSTSNPHSVDYSDVSGADAGTNITAAELEELTDGSETTLHTHSEKVSGNKVADITSIMPPNTSGTNIATGQVYTGGVSSPLPVYRTIGFDDTTVEYMDFFGVMHDDYDGTSGVTVRLDCLAANDAAGTIVMGATIGKIVMGSTDIDEDLFTDSTKQTGTATVDRQGRPERVEVDLTNAQMNSIAGGDLFVLRVQLDTSGTITNDVLLLPSVRVVYQ